MSSLRKDKSVTPCIERLAADLVCNFIKQKVGLLFDIRLLGISDA